MTLAYKRLTHCPPCLATTETARIAKLDELTFKNLSEVTPATALKPSDSIYPSKPESVQENRSEGRSRHGLRRGPRSLIARRHAFKTQESDTQALASNASIHHQKAAPRKRQFPLQKPRSEHSSVRSSLARARRQYEQYGERKAIQGKSLKNAPVVEDDAPKLHKVLAEVDIRARRGMEERNMAGSKSNNKANSQL